MRRNRNARILKARYSTKNKHFLIGFIIKRSIGRNVMTPIGFIAGSGNTKAGVLVPQTNRNLLFRFVVEVLFPCPKKSAVAVHVFP
jgi:hypothetical protein